MALRKTFKEFIQLEASGGIILLATSILALIFDNTPLRYFYQALFSQSLSISLGFIQISKPFLLWINDGLMTMFFLLVGLEVKREMFEGELNSLPKCILPGLAAIGGMLVPALIYVYINKGNVTALKGWAIPTATDIAFSLGILSLIGSRVPVSLKMFLTALAIFDDIGAIVIIGIFYTKQVAVSLLILAGVFSLVLFVLNRMRVNKIGPYLVVGIALWLCVLKSGVHATLAGIIIAFAIPLHNKKKGQESLLRHVEHKLHPWVAFGVLPIFAFANAGVSFIGISAEKFLSPITLGVACGLFFGKQMGIFGASYLGLKLKVAHMPRGVNFLGIYGIALVAGVGFTMSLFIGGLAFGQHSADYVAMVRIGVIAGSILSGIAGYLVLVKLYVSADTVGHNLVLKAPHVYLHIKTKHDEVEKKQKYELHSHVKKASHAVNHHDAEKPDQSQHKIIHHGKITPKKPHQ